MEAIKARRWKGDKDFPGNGNDEDAYALENCNVVGVVLTMSLCGLARDTGCVIANVISVKGDYANLRKLCTGKNILSISL